MRFPPGDGARHWAEFEVTEGVIVRTMTMQQTMDSAKGADQPDARKPGGGERGVVQLLAASANANFADKIATALLRAGYKLDPGAFDPDRIDAAVVLWTGVALDKPNLVAAAKEAWKAGRLAPVSIGRVEPPFGAKDATPMDLAGWRGDDDDPRWRFVLADLEVIKARRAARGEASPMARRAPRRLDAKLFDEAPGDLGADFAARDDAQRVYHPARQLWRQRISPATVPFAAGMALISAAGIAAFSLGARGDPPAKAVVAQQSTSPAAAQPPLREALNPEAAAPSTKKTPADEPAASETANDATPAPGASLAFVRPLEDIEPEPQTPAETVPREEAAISETALAENAAPETQELAAAETSLQEPADRLAMLAPSVKPRAVAPAETIAEPAESEPDLASGMVADGVLADALLAPDAPSTEETANPAATEAARQNSTRRGDYFSDCSSCPNMAALEGGGFVMGSAAKAAGSEPSEYPQRWIYIDYRFAISAREVTFDQWAACVADGGCRSYAPDDAGWGRGARPVINVSYEDASAYARWLSAKTGKYYRLPSEAEWEFAARAGRESAYAFGDHLGADEANIAGVRNGAVAVASFAPNGFGLYDMHGNVWEWTSDCWRASHHGGPATGAARIDGDCARRVIKGGGWNSSPREARSAYRQPASQTAQTSDTGFRVVRMLD